MKNMLRKIQTFECPPILGVALRAFYKKKIKIPSILNQKKKSS
jgi:hypothetical protein